jgi:hypothetical protein
MKVSLSAAVAGDEGRGEVVPEFLPQRMHRTHSSEPTSAGSFFELFVIFVVEKAVSAKKHFQKTRDYPHYAARWRNLPPIWRRPPKWWGESTREPVTLGALPDFLISQSEIFSKMRTKVRRCEQIRTNSVGGRARHSCARRSHFANLEL